MKLLSLNDSKFTLLTRQRPVKTGSRFSASALAPSAKSCGLGAELLGGDLQLQRRGQRRLRDAVEHALGEADRDRRAREQFVDQLPASRRPARPPRATRVTSPIRSASSRADQLAGHDQLLRAPEADERRQPRGAADVRYQPDARLRHPDHRVGRHHAEVAAIASSTAPPMQPPWICTITGFVISSATVPRVDALAPEGAQVLRRLRDRAERAEVHPGGEHRARAAHHDDAHVGRVGSLPSAPRRSRAPARHASRCASRAG